MSNGAPKTAAVLVGLLIAASGCGVSTARGSASSTAHSSSPAPQATTPGCGPQPPLHAWAMDITDSGRVAWQTRLPTNVNLYSQPTSPLTVGGVAIFTSDGSVVGLRLADGRRLWRWRTGQLVEAAWRWRRLVVVLTSQLGPRAMLAGLEAATGAVRWVRQLPGGLYGGQAATADGGLAVVTSHGALEAVSLATGRIRWSRRTGTSTSIAAADGLALAAFGGRLHAYNDRTGDAVWTHAGMPPQPQLQVFGGFVLVNSGETGPGITTALLALSSRTGRLVWRFDPGMPVTVLSAGPVGLAVATYVYRRLYLLNLATGRQRWRVATAAALLSVPLVTRANVIADEGGVVGFEALRLVSRAAATGRPRWDRPLAEPVIGAIVGVGSDAVVQTNSETVGPPSRLVSFRLATGQLGWQVDEPAFVSQAPVPTSRGLLVQASDLIQGCPIADISPDGGRHG